MARDGLTIAVDVSGLSVVSMQITPLLHCNYCQLHSLGIIYSGMLLEYCLPTHSVRWVYAQSQLNFVNPLPGFEPCIYQPWVILISMKWK